MILCAQISSKIFCCSGHKYQATYSSARKGAIFRCFVHKSQATYISPMQGAILGCFMHKCQVTYSSTRKGAIFRCSVHKSQAKYTFPHNRNGKRRAESLTRKSYRGHTNGHRGSGAYNPLFNQRKLSSGLAKSPDGMLLTPGDDEEVSCHS